MRHMSGTFIEIVAIVLLVLANGAFALSEIAIVSARKARLRQHAEEGKRQAGVALDLAGDPSQFLSTVQIGMTVVATLAGAFGGVTLAAKLARWLSTIPALAPHSETIAIVVVVVAISYLSLILGELAPKRIALSEPERVAMAVALPMRWLSRAAGPAVRFLSWSTDIVLRVVPVPQRGESPVTEEEVRLMIEEGTEAGAFEAAEQEMIEGVFRLGDRRAVELMRPRMSIVWLDIQDSPETLRATISGNTYSRFPVGDGSLDQVLGYVQVKDLFDSCLEGRPLDIRACIRPLPTVPGTMRALKLLEVFQQSRTHIALVVNEHGVAEGLITMHDILEAVVGDLPAPGEKADAHATRREDGSWLVDGATPIFEVKELLGLRELPGEDDAGFTTLAGFVTTQLGRIPAAGEHFEVGGKRYEVVDMDRSRVDKVLISDVPESTASTDGENS